MFIKELVEKINRANFLTKEIEKIEEYILLAGPKKYINDSCVLVNNKLFNFWEQDHIVELKAILIDKKKELSDIEKINLFDLKDNKKKHSIKFKKTHPDSKLPVKAHETDACFDCFAVSKKEHGNGVVEYDLGFAIEMPAGGRVDFRPRSSIFKTGMVLCNSVGTVDEGYRNTCKAFFYDVIKDLPNYESGDRVVQMMFDIREDFEFEEVEDLSEAERGLGGFGSTGK